MELYLLEAKTVYSEPDSSFSREKKLGDADTMLLLTVNKRGNRGDTIIYISNRQMAI